MGKIYSAPSSIKAPSYAWDGTQNWQEEEKRYRNELKALLRKRKSGKYVGEVVRFPYADSHAEYMVASLRPLELVHVPLGDAWEYPYIERLTAKDITTQIEQTKRIEAIFAKKGN